MDGNEAETEQEVRSEFLLINSDDQFPTTMDAGMGDYERQKHSSHPEWA